jgi:hypothetical protein
LRTAILAIRHEGASSEEFAAILGETRQHLGSATEIEAARSGISVAPFPDVAHGDVVRARFDGFLEFWTSEEAPSAESLRTLESLAQRLASAVDNTRTAIALGSFHEITRGSPTFVFVYAMRRLLTLEPEQFFDVWLHEHPSSTNKKPGGYAQLHVNQDFSLMAARVTDFEVADYDGICETGYPAIETFTALMNNPGVVDGALPHEASFVDHGRSALALVEIAEDGC